jgi:hypothetical protein
MFHFSHDGYNKTYGGRINFRKDEICEGIWLRILIFRMNINIIEKRTRVYGQDTLGLYTGFSVSSSMIIQFKFIIFFVKLDFILDLDKQLHEIIALDVVYFPIVHS